MTLLGVQPWSSSMHLFSSPRKFPKSLEHSDEWSRGFPELILPPESQFSMAPKGISQSHEGEKKNPSRYPGACWQKGSGKKNMAPPLCQGQSTSCMMKTSVRNSATTSQLRAEQLASPKSSCLRFGRPGRHLQQAFQDFVETQMPSSQKNGTLFWLVDFKGEPFQKTGNMDQLLAINCFRPVDPVWILWMSSLALIALGILPQWFMDLLEQPKAFQDSLGRIAESFLERTSLGVPCLFGANFSHRLVGVPGGLCSWFLF